MSGAVAAAAGAAGAVVIQQRYDQRRRFLFGMTRFALFLEGDIEKAKFMKVINNMVAEKEISLEDFLREDEVLASSEVDEELLILFDPLEPWAHRIIKVLKEEGYELD